MKGCEVRARTRCPEYGLLKTAPLFSYLFGVGGLASDLKFPFFQREINLNLKCCL